MELCVAVFDACEMTNDGIVFFEVNVFRMQLLMRLKCDKYFFSVVYFTSQQHNLVSPSE